MIFQPNIIKAGSSTTPEGWYPPAGWPDITSLISDGDNGFVGIFACFDGISNYCAFAATFSGTATVDWGDGTAESLTSGATIEHEFSYTGITSAAVTEGYKCAVVKVYSTGACSILNFGVKHTNERLYTDACWLSLRLRSTLSGIPFQYVNANDRARAIRSLDFGESLCLRGYFTFYGHYSLSRLIVSFAGCAGSVANGCVFMACGLSDFNWNDQDFSSMTSMIGFWQGAYGSRTYKLNIAIDSCTNLHSAWRQGSSFSSINLTNTSNVQDISYAINYNSAVQEFVMDDCSAVTTTSNFLYLANNTQQLKRLVLPGLKIGIDISNQPMSATALNAFFTSLGTANGAQTITITGNPGAATCDTTIATAKGFTVVT